MHAPDYCRATIFAGLTAVSAAAVAQETTTEVLQLDEIVVTSTRRAESIQDVPISISAFSSAEIERNMFSGIDDYLVRAPGVSFVSTGARDRKDIAIRGVSNLLTIDSSKRVSTFGFYIDEFNVATGTTNPQIMDMERIEVLRGPQGTYFGRNAIGGAINITTKKPDATGVYAEGTLGFARYDTYDVEGILNLPIISDKLAVRFNAKHSESDGNIRNINAIGGGNTQDYDYGRVSLRYTPTDRLTVDLAGSYTKEESGMRQGVPSGVPTVLSQSLVGNPLGLRPFVPLPDGVGFYPENRDRVNFNRAQEVGAEFYTVTGRVQYNFDTFSVTSVTGYIDSDQILLGDIDGGSLDLYYESKPIHRDSASQEIRFQSIAGKPVDWTVGGIVGRDRGGSNQYTYVGAARPFGLPQGAFFSPTIESSRSESEAAFAEATWHTTDKLDLTLGARYTKEELEFNSLNPGGAVINGQKASFDSVTPRFAASYDFTDDFTVYGTVSQGFKSGGVQVGTGFQVASYDPEELWNYEAGFKSELLDRRVRLNASVFYMKWKDLQAQFLVQPSGDVLLVSGIQNAASARSYGTEIELTGLVTEHFTVNVGGSYTKAEFEDFEGAFIDNVLHDLSGRELPNAPEFTFNADAEYRRPVTASINGFARLEWFYRDSVRPSLQALVYNGFPWEVPSFSHTNLRFGIEGGRYTVTAYVDNLFDKEYYTNAYEKAFLGGMYVEPSFQSYGIRVSVRTD